MCDVIANEDYFVPVPTESVIVSATNV